MKLRLMIFSASALLATLPSTLYGRDLRPLAVEDALRIRTFFQTPPAFSHDGKWLAYAVTDNGASRQTMETGASWMLPTDIYTSAVETGATRNLTGGKGSNWMPVWSPDGRFLAFFSTRGGDGRRLWVWDVEKDLLRMVSAVEVRGDQIEWMPDGRSLAVTTSPRIPFREGGEKSAVGNAFAHPEDKITGSTVTVFHSLAELAPASEPWSLEIERCELVLIDVTSGKTTSVAKAQRVARYLLSPDGSAIAYTDPVQFEQPGSQQILFDLVTVNLTTKQRHVVALSVRLDHDGAQFSWSPNGRELSFQTGGVSENNHDCYVVDRYMGRLRNVTGLQQHNSTYKTAAPLWDQSGTNIYFIRDGVLWRAAAERNEAAEVAEVPGHRIVQLASRDRNTLWTSRDGKSTVVVAYDNRQKQDGFYRIDLTSGEGEQLLERGECYTCTIRTQYLMVSDEGQRFAYFAEDAQHDTDLWVSDPSPASSRRLTRLNPQFDNYKMGETMLVDWLSDDGEPLSGAVLLPPDYLKGKRYPAVIWVYGGASLSENLHHFGLAYPGAFNMQLLATRGYVVLLPDAPCRPGSPMLDMAKTVLPGLNKLIEIGIADSQRVGVIGHSNGGYSTLALIVQTRRFRAAVEVDGFASVMGVYGEMDELGDAFGMSVQEHGAMGGTPWQSRQRYIENSPIFYLDRVDTPLLIMQGKDDEVVAPFLADEVFVDLRRLGKEVEYAKYSGEGHSPLLWRYANQVDLCNRIIGWFESHLKSVTGPTSARNR
jgi:dipeptidyl aminopeptidase/acylaminoacyl peptidase